jgi:hypothetical protein
MTDHQTTAATAVRVTRAAALFDRLVATLLAHLDADAQDPAAQVPAAQDAGAGGQAELRERLDAFFPEFRQLYGSLLVKHIGAKWLPGVLEVLCSEAVQVYFRALQAMEPELIGGLQQLTKRMAVVASAGSPA